MNEQALEEEEEQLAAEYENEKKQDKEFKNGATFKTKKEQWTSSK